MPEKRLQEIECGGQVMEHLEHHCSDRNYVLGALSESETMQMEFEKIILNVYKMRLLRARTLELQ